MTLPPVARLHIEDCVVFPYLDSVLDGDGGLLVMPGSHKSEFTRPSELCGPCKRATPAPRIPRVCSLANANCSACRCHPVRERMGRREAARGGRSSRLGGLGLVSRA
jgi:hypothetical protein